MVTQCSPKALLRVQIPLSLQIQDMAELVDALDSKSSFERNMGSSPIILTYYNL